MKKSVVILILLATCLVISITGCHNSRVPYTGVFISDELGDGYQKTTIEKVERLLNTKIPVPAYLPLNISIREVYYIQYPDSKPEAMEILFLISDKPIFWEGNKYQTRLEYIFGWNKPGFGLKMPWAEYYPGAGKLEQRNGEWIFWWESRIQSPDSFGSTANLIANVQFSKDELIKIAESTPR